MIRLTRHRLFGTAAPAVLALGLTVGLGASLAQAQTTGGAEKSPPAAQGEARQIVVEGANTAGDKTPNSKIVVLPPPDADKKSADDKTVEDDEPSNNAAAVKAAKDALDAEKAKANQDAGAPAKDEAVAGTDAEKIEEPKAKADAPAEKKAVEVEEAVKPIAKSPPPKRKKHARRYYDDDDVEYDEGPSYRPHRAYDYEPPYRVRPRYYGGRGYGGYEPPYYAD